DGQAAREAGEDACQPRREVRRLEVHPAEGLKEGVADREIPRVAVVEQGHVATADVDAVGGAVAALVPDLEGVPGQVAAGAALDLGPHALRGDLLVVVLPAAGDR